MKHTTSRGADARGDVLRRAFLRSSLEVMAVALFAGCRMHNPRHGTAVSDCGCGVRAPIIPVDNSINWDDGRFIRIVSGETATCSMLSPGQLYCIFLYNSSNADHDIDVTVVWSNAKWPVVVTVPGSTDDEGPASLVLVSGSDTSTISVAITQMNDAIIECWLGSVEMPTNISGLSDCRLLANGRPRPVMKKYRYHAVPGGSWYQLTVENKLSQSVVVQFRQRKIIIYIVNPTADAQVLITPLGSVQQGREYLIEEPPQGQQPQRFTSIFQGNGMQLVWMSAGSRQDSQHTFITLQSLSASES